MMAETFVTFGLVSEIAGITEGQLRNWLDRKQIGPIGDKRGSTNRGWRSFTFLDALRLAAISRLIRYGVSIDCAARIAVSGIHDGRKMLLIKVGEKSELVAECDSGAEIAAVMPGEAVVLVLALSRLREEIYGRWHTMTNAAARAT